MVTLYVQGGVSLQQRMYTKDGKLASAFSRFCRCFLFLVYTDKSNLTKLYTTLILLYPMLLSLDGLAATPFAPFRVKLLLLHAGEALHLSNGSPLSLVQTMAGEMDYQN